MIVNIITLEEFEKLANKFGANFNNEDAIECGKEEKEIFLEIFNYDPTEDTEYFNPAGKTFLELLDLSTGFDRVGIDPNYKYLSCDPNELVFLYSEGEDAINGGDYKFIEILHNDKVVAWYYSKD